MKKPITQVARTACYSHILGVMVCVLFGTTSWADAPELIAGIERVARVQGGQSDER